jgi:hypothetical protein
MLDQEQAMRKGLEAESLCGGRGAEAHPWRREMFGTDRWRQSHQTLRRGWTDFSVFAYHAKSHMTWLRNRKSAAMWSDDTSTV